MEPPGIGVTPDGVFHPVWIDAGKGEGEISTAAVNVVPADTLVSEATVGLEDVTNKVAVVYGGDQRFDPKTNTITLDVTIRNTSDQPLKGPIKLAVTGVYKNYGYSEVANAPNKATGAGAVWDLSASVPGSALVAGATSKPFPLKFLYKIDPRMERNSDDIFGLNVKVFAAQ